MYPTKFRLNLLEDINYDLDLPMLLLSGCLRLYWPNLSDVVFILPKLRATIKCATLIEPLALG